MANEFVLMGKLQLASWEANLPTAFAVAADDGVVIVEYWLA